MKHQTHPFKSDEIILSWFDLLRLAFGATLKGVGTEIRRK